MQASNQTLKFIIADFVTGWKRRIRSDGVIEYLALQNGGKLKIVTTEPSGEMKTDFYQVPFKGIVSVINDVIHIPSRFYENMMGILLRWRYRILSTGIQNRSIKTFEKSENLK